MQLFKVLVKQKINKQEEILARAADYPDQLKEWIRKKRPDLEFIKILSRQDLTEAQADVYRNTQKAS